MAEGATAEISEKHTGKSGDSHLQSIHQEVRQTLRGNGDHESGYQAIHLFGDLVIDGLHHAENSNAYSGRKLADVASAALKGVGAEVAKETKTALDWTGKHPAEALLIGATVSAGAVQTGDFQTFVDTAVAKFPALGTFFKPLDSAHRQRVAAQA